jgi:hypothetical protein
MDNIKEEVTNDMENLRKKNKPEIQNTMEGHSSRLEQLEDRISELEMSDHQTNTTKILQRILYIENESKQNYERTVSIKP